MIIQNHINNNNTEHYNLLDMINNIEQIENEFESEEKKNQISLSLVKPDDKAKTNSSCNLPPKDFTFRYSDSNFGSKIAYTKDHVLIAKNEAEVINIPRFNEYLTAYKKGFNTNFQSFVKYVKHEYAINCDEDSPLDYALRYRLIFAANFSQKNCIADMIC